MPLRISLIVRCLNEAEHLPKFFGLLEQQSVRPDQVVLVDSGSADESVAIARSRGAHIVHLRQEEFTYGRALNVGIEHANAEILVMVSAHTYPATGRWLEELTAPITCGRATFTYGRQIGDHRTCHSEHRVIEQWFPSASEPRQSVPFAHNANSALRRDVWEKHKFDEALSGLEDVEMAGWILEQGLELSYVAEACITHVHVESWSQRYRRYFREGSALGTLHARSSLPLRHASAWFLAHVMADLRADTRHGIRPSLAGVLGFRAAQYLGAYRGMRSPSQRRHSQTTAARTSRTAVVCEVAARMYAPQGAISADQSDAGGICCGAA